MRPTRSGLSIAVALALFLPPAARADHDITENYNNLPCCLLSEDTDIVRELPLFTNNYFTRSELTNFLDDFVLPVENGDDLELLWDNTGIGAGESLALDAEDHGLYRDMQVTIETDLAMWSVDPTRAERRGGVVVRQLPTPFEFYCAYAKVTDEGGLTIRPTSRSG